MKIADIHESTYYMVNNTWHELRNKNIRNILKYIE